MQVEKTNTTEKSNKIDDINFKIKIMLNCYLHGILRLGEAMAAVQMNGFIIAASASQEPDVAEVNYATYLAAKNPELKEYIKDPIGYIRACEVPRGNSGNYQSIMMMLINTHPHIFAIALTRGIETSQKQALIAAEMMCKCITADLRCLAMCIFMTNLVHKLVMIEDSALFLLEILNESAKIACEYLPGTEMRKELMEIANAKDMGSLLDGFGKSGQNLANYRVLYLICWVVRKMHEWITLFNARKMPAVDKVKALFKFYADLMLDLEDIFAEVIERGDQRNSNQNYLLFILPLLNAITGVIIASYCCTVSDRGVKNDTSDRSAKGVCLTYFAPAQKSQNPKLYQIALSWIEALLFE